MVRIMALAATPAGSELLQPGAEGGDEDKSGTALAWVLPPSIVIPLHGGQAPGPGHRFEDTMTHDKIRAAARQRMAQTGEPYTAARAPWSRGTWGRAARHRHRARATRCGCPARSATGWSACATATPLRPARWRRHWSRCRARAHASGSRWLPPRPVPGPQRWPKASTRSYREQVERLTAVRRIAANADTLVHDIREHVSHLESAREGMQALRRRLLDTGRAEGAEKIAAKLATTEQQLAQVRRLRPKRTEASLRLVTEAGSCKPAQCLPGQERSPEKQMPRRTSAS